MKKVTVEREFRRQAGPRSMYGCVTITACFAADFWVKSVAEWPPDFDKARYEKAIYCGITEALNEFYCDNPIGNFWISAVKFSEDIDANVPIAYREAAKQAVFDIVKDWPQPSRPS